MFDVSEANGGVPFDSLSDALGTNGGNVPSSYRTGGMSVKFILQLYTVVKTTSSEQPTGTELQSEPTIANGTKYKASDLISAFATLPTSSDVVYYVSNGEETPTYTIYTLSKNAVAACEYVQYRYMSTNAATNSTFVKVANWQGVDETPTVGSKNFVTSRGVVENSVGQNQLLGINSIPQFYGAYIAQSGWATTNQASSHSVLKVSGGENFEIKWSVDNIYIAFVKSYAYPESNSTQIDYATGYSAPIYITKNNGQSYTFTLPGDCRYVIITRHITASVDRIPSLIKINGVDIINGISKNLNDLNALFLRLDDEISENSQQILNKVDINSINIIDWESIQPAVNKYYGSDGTLKGGTGDDTYCALPLIKIIPSTVYTLSCIRSSVISGIGNTACKICFYTENDISTFIEESAIDASTQTFTTPENANYIGISIFRYNTEVSEPCFQLGSQRNYASYNPISGYANTFPITIPDNSVGEAKLTDLSVSTSKIKDTAVTPIKTSFFESSKNLFDYTSVTDGKYVSISGGLATNSRYCASDYIPVISGRYIISNKYGIGGAYNCFYDSDKTFISGAYFQSMPILVPENAAYVRLSFNNTQTLSIQDVQVEYGQETTEFVPYGYVIDEKYLPHEDEIERQRISLPSKLYMLSGSGINFDIFYEPIMKLWNPYKYDIRITTYPGRNYVKAIKRVCTLSQPSTPKIIFDVYDSEKEKYILNKESTLIKGISGQGTNVVKIGIIGDSYTDGGCFTPVLLDSSNVPNLQMVGTHAVNETTYANQRLDGRSGWSMSTFFNVQTGTDYFNPFYHPEGNHRYWGNTGFWAGVCGGNPGAYQKRYAHYSSLCDATGWPVSPIEGDVIYDSTNQVFKEYQSNTWVQTASNVEEVKTYYTWEFNYQKYLSMWSIDVADIFGVYLGVNDFWIIEVTDERLELWQDRLDIIISQYHSSNPTGKFVVILPNTVTYQNSNHYQPLDVHRHMWMFRDFLIKNYDNRESELIYVVDTAHLIDSQNSFTLQETNPFDGYPNGYSYTNKEVWTSDGQHPRVSYTTLGYSLAGFIQAMR